MGKFFVGFLLGGMLAFLAFTYLYPLVAPRAVHTVGTLAHAPRPDPAVSGTDPEGYYIEATTRFYLEAVDPGWVGKPVFVSGPLDAICGPDGWPCYPKIRGHDIKEARQAQPTKGTTKK